ncbi:MBL fold metallo-hydrolase [Hydrogenivirga sp.]
MRTSKLLFLGTAGGRVTTFRLVRRSGGFLIDFSGTNVQVDPGPGAFVYLKEHGIDYRDIDLIVLSHIHLDHTADVNTLIEACTDGGKRRELALFAPASALEGKDRVVLPYLMGRLTRVGVIEEGIDLSYKGVKVRAVMKHSHHGAETYGLSFNDDAVVYLSCAKYEESMLEVYPKEPKVFIINTTFYRRRGGIEHLSVEEVKELISVCKAETTVITHFSMEMHERGPERVARELSDELGLNVVAAHDGMVLTF